MASDCSGEDLFGFSVSNDADTFLIGAIGDHDKVQNSILVYIFDRPSPKLRVRFTDITDPITLNHVLTYSFSILKEGTGPATGVVL